MPTWPAFSILIRRSHNSVGPTSTCRPISSLASGGDSPPGQGNHDRGARAAENLIQVHQRRQLVLILDAVRPMPDQRRRDTAFVDPRFVQLERRVRIARPALAEPKKAARRP